MIIIIKYLRNKVFFLYIIYFSRYIYIRRNIARFAEDMYFQLTADEYKNLMFQSGTSNNTHGGVRKMPYVFTESGVGMLSGILHTPKTIETSKAIMKAFVQRKTIKYNKQFIN